MKQWGAGITMIGKGILLSGFGDIAKGLALLTPLLAAANTFSELGSQINDMSERSGIAADRIAALNFAADQTGASFEELEGGIKHMQKALFEAGEGSKEAHAGLQRLGVSAAELQRLTPDEQLARLADGFARIADPAERTGAAMKVFGKSGTKMIGILSGGSAGLRAFEEEARAAGIAMSKEDIAAADALGDAFSKLKMAIKFAFAGIGGALAGDLKDLFGEVTRIVKGISDFAKANPGIIKAVAAFAAFSIAIGVIQVVIAPVVMAFGALVTLLSFAIPLFIGLAKFAVALGVALFSVKGLLLAAGIAFLVLSGHGKNAFEILLSTGKQMLADLAALWTNLKEIAIGAWQGIGDALKAGDLALAGKIALAGLAAAWAQASGTIRIWWEEFKDFVVGLWENATTRIAASFVSMWAEIQIASEATLATVGAGLVDLAEQMRDVPILGRLAKDIVQGGDDVDPAEVKKQLMQQSALNLQNIQKQRVAQKKALEEMAAEDERRRKAALDARLKEIREQMGAAKDELDKLRQEAAAKAAQVAQKVQAPEEAAAAVAKGVKPGAAAGTFSAATAALLGGGVDNVQNRIADLARQQLARQDRANVIAERMLTELKQRQLVFN